MNCPLFTIKDPDGCLVHTVVGTEPEDVVENFMDIERAMFEIFRAGLRDRGEKDQCFPSWEQWEAQGYQIVPVQIVQTGEPLDTAEIKIS